jgi:hypothetical protein
MLSKDYSYMIGFMCFKISISDIRNLYKFAVRKKNIYETIYY